MNEKKDNNGCIVLKAVLFASQKMHQSKTIDEDEATFHLQEDGGLPICGVAKRFPDQYFQGFVPVLVNEATKNICCQNCERVAISKYGW